MTSETGFRQWPKMAWNYEEHLEWILRSVRTSGYLLHEDKKGEREGHIRIKDWNIRPRCRWENNIKMSLREMEWDGMD
jgi:hypothetical protein